MRYLALLTFAALALPAHAAERRCGWLTNPTPSNYWLIDRDGEWTLSEQGVPEHAEGMEEMPDMSKRGWVVTNGSSYGYGCACMTVEIDHKTKWVTKIISATPRPLRQCRTDRRLGKP